METIKRTNWTETILFNNAIGENIPLEVETNANYHEDCLVLYSISYEDVKLFEWKKIEPVSFFKGKREDVFNMGELERLCLAGEYLYDVDDFLDLVMLKILE